MNTARIALGVALCLAMPQTSLPAELRLPRIFGHNMVLQCDASIPVWGTAGPGERVTVSFAAQERTTTAGTNGLWRLDLPPVSAGGPHVFTVTSSSTLSFTNVLVGEVWFCGGQSNMEWPLAKTEGGPTAVAAAKHPDMRFFTVRKTSMNQPQFDCDGQWTLCSPETAGRLSGVAYHFGRDIQTDRKVPVGLIVCARSGAAIESFLAADTLAQHPDFKRTFDEHAAYRSEYAAAVSNLPARLAEWDRLAAQAKADGREPPRRPGPPKHPDGPERGLCNLYNGMVHPLIPYAIRGMTWYQGENNIINVEDYSRLFPYLIRDWRARWRQGDFPFLFVQICTIGKPSAELQDDNWCRIRDSQLAGLRETNTAMVTTIDIGDGTLHPPNKRDVGKRLAMAALNVAYGRKDVVCMGPVSKAAEFNGSEVTIRFTHVGGGLTARGDGPLKGFALAGDDRKFAWADARIAGDTVIVSCSKIPAPVAVRYGWAPFPECNLYNREGLPASPFRTDSWPMP